MGELKYRTINEFPLMQGNKEKIVQVYKNFACMLKKRRKEIHFSEEKAAKSIGVSTNFSRDVERGSKYFSFPMMIRAMYLFSISFNDFLFYKNENNLALQSIL